MNDNQVWIYGKHSVYSVLKNKSRKVYRVIATSQNNTGILKNFHLNNVEVLSADSIGNILNISGNKHQGVAILCSKKTEISLSEFHINEKANIIILDNITDTRNIGSIIRTAVAFGVNAILYKENTFKENSQLIKTAVGTVENIKFIKVKNIIKAMEVLKKNDFWIVGLSGNGSYNIKDVPKSEKLAFVLGSEDKGIRKLIAQSCDFLAYIPITKNVDSLNVSNANAIALYALLSDSLK